MRFRQFSEESKSFEKDLKTWLLDNNLPVSKCCSAYLLDYNHPSLGQPDGYGICDNCNKMSEAINYMDLDEGAMDDTVEIMKKSFSPERKAVQAEVLGLVRAVQMGKGDKMELAMKITALAKSELEAKRNDPDLKISVDQNLGMLDRAMKAVTGMSEGITEEELEEYKSLSSLRNRSNFDAMARLQDKNKPKEPKVIEIPKGTQLDLFKKASEDIEEALTEAQFDEAAGEKDACYRKVKSRYKVWPSAYASGALVKCRKVGAANWGNSKKK